MGFHIWSGRGTKKDPARGRRLLQEAAAKGIAVARDYLKRIEGDENQMLSTPGLKGKPRTIVENLVNGRPIKINRATHPFLSGLSQSLIGRCAKTIKPSDLGVLTRFSISGTSNLIFGSDYSNKNLGKAVGSQIQNNALISLGIEVGKRITCKRAVSGKIAGIIAKSVRANESSNVFINTCRRSFNKNPMQLPGQDRERRDSGYSQSPLSKSDYQGDHRPESAAWIPDWNSLRYRQLLMHGGCSSVGPSRNPVCETDERRMLLNRKIAGKTANQPDFALK